MRSNIISPNVIIYLFGKLCLVAAIGFAFTAGSNYYEAQRFHLPSLDLATPEVAGAQPGAKQRAHYRVISQRNIFGVKKTEQAQGPVAEKPTELNLRLVGTNPSSGRNAFAIIEDQKGKKQDVFELGSQVFDRAKLLRIEQEYITVEHNGKPVRLDIEYTERKGGGPSLSSTSESTSTFSISEEELQQQLADLPRLLTQARAVPYFRNGKSIGMRLFAIRRGSLYEKLGLKNGDIIKTINGDGIGDPAQALKIFEKLKTEKEIGVTLERSGQQTTLNYTIN